MTARIERLRAEIVVLERAIARTWPQAVEAVIVNDPESEELLGPYRRELDQRVCYEICPGPQAG
jgi:hypothetical protein